MLRNPGKHFPYSSVGLSALPRQFSKEAGLSIDSPSFRPTLVDPLTSFPPILPFSMIPSKRKMERRRKRLGNMACLFQLKREWLWTKGRKNINNTKSERRFSDRKFSGTQRLPRSEDVCVSVLQSPLSLGPPLTSWADQAVTQKQTIFRLFPKARDRDESCTFSYLQAVPL